MENWDGELTKMKKKNNNGKRILQVFVQNNFLVMNFECS